MAVTLVGVQRLGLVNVPLIKENREFCNDFKYMDKVAQDNSVDPDETAPFREQSDQGMHCLPFCMHYFEKHSTDPLYNHVICS